MLLQGLQFCAHLAFTLFSYNCLYIETELQYVSHSFIMYRCGLDGKLTKRGCCLLRARCWKAILLHLVPMFRTAIVFVSAHEGCGSEQNSKLPKTCSEKAQEGTMHCQVTQAFWENNYNFCWSSVLVRPLNTDWHFLKLCLSFYSLLKLHKCLSAPPWASERQDSPFKKHCWANSPSNYVHREQSGRPPPDVLQHWQ